MFHKSSAYYDLIYREMKDYADEAMKLNYLFGLFEPKPKRILDVGCGTGEHALHLSRNFGYKVDGIDIEPGLIEIAAAKMPNADFTVADMKGFHLPTKYDVAICLFSSIGYVETLDGLDSAFKSIGKHLKKGGWFICEPWLSPEDWKEGQVDVVEAGDPETGETISRTRIGKTDGNVSVLKIEYDVSGRQKETHFEETHRLGLFTQDQISKSLEKAGFEPRWAEHGLQAAPFVVATYLP